MNKPYIDSISTKSDSKYLLIVAAAKRARQITLNEPELTRSGKVNPVSRALHEIDEDELTWEITDKLPEDVENSETAADADLAEAAETIDALEAEEDEAVAAEVLAAAEAED